MADGPFFNADGIVRREHNEPAAAKRTLSVGFDGEEYVVEEFVVKRTPLSKEDTDFLTGESPAILDVNDAYGQNGRSFEVINDGVGSFTVSISNDGTAFGNEVTVKQQEKYALDNISVDKVRITWVENSAYRIRAI